MRGRFLTGRVRSSRKSPRAAVPAKVATGEGKDRYRATTRKLLLMPRHVRTPGWVASPGWQGPAAERRQAAAADAPTAGEHRCPRGRESARPGLGLTRAERVNLVRVRRAGAGMRRRGGRPTVRGAEVPGGTGCPGSECRRLKGSRKASAAGPGLLPEDARITGRIPSWMLGPVRALTWAGEPLRRSERKCRY